LFALGKQPVHTAETFGHAVRHPGLTATASMNATYETGVALNAREFYELNTRANTVEKNARTRLSAYAALDQQALTAEQTQPKSQDARRLREQANTALKAANQGINEAVTARTRAQKAAFQARMAHLVSNLLAQEKHAPALDQIDEAHVTKILGFAAKVDLLEAVVQVKEDIATRTRAAATAATGKPGETQLLRSAQQAETELSRTQAELEQARAAVHVISPHDLKDEDKQTRLLSQSMAKGFWNRSKVSIFNAALEASAVGVCAYGLTMSDVAQEYLIGGYAGTVLGLGWGVGTFPVDLKNRVSQLWLQGLYEQNLAGYGIAYRAAHLGRLGQVVKGVNHNLTPEERASAIKVLATTGALLGGIALGGLGAVDPHMPAVLQTIFDQICGGMFGPLIQFAVRSAYDAGVIGHARTDATKVEKLDLRANALGNAARKAETAAKDAEESGAANAAGLRAMADKAHSKAQDAHAAAEKARNESLERAAGVKKFVQAEDAAAQGPAVVKDVVPDRAAAPPAAAAAATPAQPA
jgi:hypothetical protein